MDLVEAEVLRDSVGQRFDAVVVAVDQEDPRKGDVVVQQPAIEASVTGAQELPLGTNVTVRLVRADPATRTVRFELA